MDADAPQRVKRDPGGRRSKRTHEAILSAADALIREKGYLNVTIEAIAARAGAGKQTIYRWWPSKAALYMELYSVLANRHIRLPDRGSVAADLKDLFYQLFDLFEKTSASPALAGLIAEAQANPDLTRILFGELVTRRRHLWHILLQRGVQRGELRRDLDLELAIDMLAGPVWYRLLLGHAPLDRKFADAFVAEFLTGARAETATPSGAAAAPALKTARSRARATRHR